MTAKKPLFRFPKKFLWGAATAAHQVEGGTHNNWSVWELDNAKTLAAQSEYQFGDLHNWPVVRAEATDPQNYVSGDAVKHYEMYEQDLDIARKMNMNAFRFSVEWSRIEPEEGAWNAEAIEHYKDYISALRKRGLEPIVTLFHFTLPIWFAEMGGFEKKANVKYFVLYAEKIITELGPHVKLIITINEPDVYVGESYFTGHWPPNMTSKRKLRRVYINLAHAHNEAARVIHGMNRRYKLSIAKNTSYIYAGDDALLSRKTADIMQYFTDDYFLKKVINTCDFIGVNYYLSSRVYGYRVHNPDVLLNDMGWDMAPENIQFALERLHDKYKKPLLITENGLADTTDTHRKWWITQTIIAMQKSMEHGVELWGYLHWSLLDNFEWDKGKWPRFGLIAVDYTTMKRTPRPSAIWFAGVLKKIRKEDS